jgi:hypothetical protein
MGCRGSIEAISRGGGDIGGVSRGIRIERFALHLLPGVAGLDAKQRRLA